LNDKPKHQEEEDQLPAKGFKKPFFPRNGPRAEPRRWDGNEILGHFWKQVAGWMRPILRVRAIEFVYTLISGPVIYDEPIDIPHTPEGVQDSISTGNVQRLQELYDHCRWLMDREEGTRTSVEGRANVLLGVGGLTTTLIIGVSGLLARGDLDKVLPSGTLPYAAFIGLYIFAVFALIMSLLRAVQTSGIAYFQPFSATKPFEVQECAPAPRLHRLIREAFLTYVDLRHLNRIKVGLLGAAQWWFGVALFLLLTIATVPVVVPVIGMIADSVGQLLSELRR
jgi:hypothetical protein